MQNRQSVEWQMARSRVYGLLGSLLSDRPDGKTIRQLTSARTVESISGMFDDPELGLKMRALADSFRSGNLSTEEVVLDFEGLLRVPGAFYTHPYESNYSGRERGNPRSTWSGVCGRQTSQVERCYRDEELEPRYDRVDFADHIGAELIFMAHVCRKTAEAVRAGRSNESESLLAKQRQFADDHLFNWAGDFSAEMAKKAETPFFQAVAALLTAFLQLEQEASTFH